MSHDHLLRLFAIQMFPNNLRCQRRRFDIFFTCIRRNYDPVSYFAVDLHRYFDFILFGGFCIEFGPVLLMDRVGLAEVIRPQFFSDMRRDRCQHTQVVILCFVPPGRAHCTSFTRLDISFINSIKEETTVLNSKVSKS